MAQDPTTLIGKKAPALKAKALMNSAGVKGGGANLSLLKGKVVVLDFWAYW